MKPLSLFCFLLLCCSTLASAASPVRGLLERIAPGSSGKFIIEQVASDGEDFFKLDQQGSKVVIRGNNPVSIATGLNWYLKYHAGIHLSWNNMTAHLPDTLPPVGRKERRNTKTVYRYDFNYCTFSYTMAFWDWKRWEQEIDWMALHGINLALALVGTDAWYEDRISLQKKILKRMREYGIHPVLPGYAGMLPHNAAEKIEVNVANPGTWNGYNRPADVLRAARLFLEEADGFKGNDNFEYDLIDITRQAVAEKGRLVYKVIRAAYEAQDKPLLRLASDRFLELLLQQDRLLATRPEFKAGRWIAQARSIGHTPQEKDWIEWNARVQITTWGNRTASEGGGLHDYAHKEWNGLLRDFYYPRWKTWLDRLNTLPDGDPAAAIDYYALDEPWTLQHNFYPPHKEGDCVEAAKEAAQHLYFF